MSVTVTVNGPKLDELPITSEALMKEIGLLAERLIRTRTERQIDVNGAPFRPLSAGYAKQKAQAGLSPVPDLTVSGRMLNDMTVTEVTKNTATIGFISSGGVAPRGSTFIQRSRAVGAADKAYYHTEVGAGASQVKREFFGIGPAEEEQIETALTNYLDKVLE